MNVVLVEGAAKLLPDLQAGMGEYSARALRSRGVEGRARRARDRARRGGPALQERTDDALGDGRVERGRAPRPRCSQWFAARTAARRDRRRTPTCPFPGGPGLWALGDCASIPDPQGGWYPGTAQHAIRQGPALADNIVATLRGQADETVTYRAIGMMASLGGRRGVAGLWNRYLLTGFRVVHVALVLSATSTRDRPARARRARLDARLIFPRDIAELRMSAKGGRHLKD